MHNADFYGLKCTSGETLSLSCTSLFISPYGYISGHVKSYACLQCAVCQGSGSNWLTSCCYFTCLSLFFRTFPKPWHDSRATAAFAGEKNKKKDSSFAPKSNFFFRVRRNAQGNKVFMFVCMQKWESFFLLGKIWQSIFPSQSPPKLFEYINFVFYCPYLYLLPCFIWFSLFYCLQPA